MTYCLLRQDCNPGVWMSRAAEHPDFASFLTGSITDPLDEPVRIILASDAEEPSDFLESPYFVISDAMRNALEKSGVDNVQFFAAELAVEESDRVIGGGYWLGNVVGLVAIVDAARSTFKRLSGGKQGPLRQFYVDDSEVHGLLLFRVAEARTLVLIHEKVKECLQEAGLQGIYYQDTSQFKGKPASSFWD